MIEKPRGLLSRLGSVLRGDGSRRTGRERSARMSRLLQAMGDAGCCVCTVVTTAEVRSFQLLLWESVSDPRTRRDLRVTLNPCALHTYRLYRVGREVSNDALGLAILFRDRVAEVEQRLGRLGQGRAAADILEASAPCPPCQDRHRREHEYLAEVSLALDDEHFRQCLKASGGLCTMHRGPLTDASLNGRATGSPAPDDRDADRRAMPPRRNSLRAASVIGAATVLADPGHTSRCPICRTHRRGYDAGHSTGVSRPDGLVLDVPGGEVPEDGVAGQHQTPSSQRCRAGWRAAADACRGLPSEGPDEALCLPHLRLVAQRGQLGQVFARRQAALFSTLEAELGEFVRKSDWQYRDEPKGAEQRSWIVAADLLFGPGQDPPSFAAGLPGTAPEPGSGSSAGAN